MKKCPFCAEMIQDEATVCKWCGRNLSRAPRFLNKLRRFIILLVLCSGLVSLFLPIVKLKLPIFKESSFSVIDIVKQALNKDSGQNLSVRDLYAIKGIVQENLPGKYSEKLNKYNEKFYLAVIKISAIILILGYACYFLVIILGIFGFNKIVATFAFVSFLSSAYSLLIINIFNKILQNALSKAQADMSEEPFGAMLTTMFKEVSIAPGYALYILAIAMGLVFLISIIWRQRKA